MSEVSWNVYSHRFVPVRLDPTVKPFADKAELSGSKLLVAVDDLVSVLKDKRSTLSLEWDVPFVAELNGVR